MAALRATGWISACAGMTGGRKGEGNLFSWSGAPFGWFSVGWRVLGERIASCSWAVRQLACCAVSVTARWHLRAARWAAALYHTRRPPWTCRAVALVTRDQRAKVTPAPLMKRRAPPSAAVAEAASFPALTRGLGCHIP